MKPLGAQKAANGVADVKLADNRRHGSLPVHLIPTSIAILPFALAAAVEPNSTSLNIESAQSSFIHEVGSSINLFESVKVAGCSEAEVAHHYGIEVAGCVMTLTKERRGSCNGVRMDSDLTVFPIDLSAVDFARLGTRQQKHPPAFCIDIRPNSEWVGSEQVWPAGGEPSDLMTVRAGKAKGVDLCFDRSMVAKRALKVLRDLVTACSAKANASGSDSQDSHLQNAPSGTPHDH